MTENIRLSLILLGPLTSWLHSGRPRVLGELFKVILDKLLRLVEVFLGLPCAVCEQETLPEHQELQFTLSVSGVKDLLYGPFLSIFCLYVLECLVEILLAILGGNVVNDAHLA